MSRYIVCTPYLQGGLIEQQLALARLCLPDLFRFDEFRYDYKLIPARIESKLNKQQLAQACLGLTVPLTTTTTTLLLLLLLLHHLLLLQHQLQLLAPVAAASSSPALPHLTLPLPHLTLPYPYLLQQRRALPLLPFELPLKKLHLAPYFAYFTSSGSFVQKNNSLSFWRRRRKDC